MMVHEAFGIFCHVPKSYNKVEHQEIVVRFLNKNAFFAYSDNLLIAMLADERQSVRLRALSLISDVPGPHK